MSTGQDQDVIAALLIQAADCAERISDLDTRETAASARMELLGGRVDAIAGILGRHAAVVTALDGLDQHVAAIASQVADLAGAAVTAEAGGYEPVPPPRWWHLDETERHAAAGRLRAWVEQVYQPGYGRLAAALPACWESHPLCLYTLDWLSELWSALYLGSQRSSGTLAAQAEWQTRLLPAAADQMALDAATCRHHRSSRPPRPDPAGRADRKTGQ